MFKTVIVAVLCVAVVGAFFAVIPGMTPATPLENKTFGETTDNFWHTAANWDPPGAPDSDDHAIIPTGESCLIRNADSDAEALSFEIDGTASRVPGRTAPHGAFLAADDDSISSVAC